MGTILMIQITSALLLLFLIEKAVEIPGTSSLEESGMEHQGILEKKIQQQYLEASERMESLTQKIDLLGQELSKMEQSVKNLQSIINMILCNMQSLDGQIR